MLQTQNHQTIKRRTRKTLVMLLAAILLVQCMNPSVFATATVETAGNAGCLISAGGEGGNYSMVLKADGTVEAWGDNFYGQCNVPTGLGDVVAISGGGRHSMALKSVGTVEAWGCQGYYNYGQCDVPSGLTDVVAIAAGYEHSMALKSNGTIVAWGRNDDDGQCNVPSGLGDVVAIAAALFHSMALKADGTVAAWGYNNCGQCDVPSGLTDVVAIAAGYEHSMALKSNGTIVAWGRNDDDGQCNVPSGLGDVVAIEAGLFHSMALKADGTVAAWGYNNCGQCDVPSCLTNVVAIAGGAFHCMALKSDGTVVAWGDNYGGRCDVPSGLGDVVAIEAGTYHSMALKADGTVVAWGDGGIFDYGQSDVPSGLGDVVAIEAGYEHSMALKSNGTIVAWGRNDNNGQCNVPTGLNLSGRYLNNMLINNGAWPFDFDPDAVTYTLEVPNAVDSIGISPFADDDIQIKVQGDTKASGSTTDIALNMGSNTITIDTVDTFTGLKCPYTITVNRAMPDTTNTNLYKLETGTGVLSPAFDPDTTAYIVSVGNTISSIDITVRPEDGNATTAIGGQSAGSGEQTVSVPLDAGENAIPIVVQAGDNTTTKEYTVNVVRGPSSNADLSALSVGTGSLSPTFDADTVAYSV